ncbi:MAG: phosphate/phosphite/phosphonate ABC transporter substrate-binding protein [Sulfurimonadaceae bacterium]|jgi:phosphonate transport system substrate-binding protein|nr:phosphate/phosphite/phosphonate ABC transporter substrate-binding protein [Sulfurimonadaceae bacterium]
MIKIIVLFFLSFCLLFGEQKELRVGFLSIESSEMLYKKLAPFATYLENQTGMKVSLYAGCDYKDTIDKITNEVLDIVYLGPVPYIKAKEKNPLLKIIASLENANEDAFKSVIFVKKGSNLKTLPDLKGKTFAFGSRNSTLSYYVPMYMLKKQNIDTQLERFAFLGRHDRVAQYVIMGKYDAGSIKTSVAEKYSDYIEVIARSEQYDNFLFLASSQLDDATFTKIQNALLELKNEQILKAFDANSSGFIKKEDKEYDSLRKLVKIVDMLKR